MFNVLTSFGLFKNLHYNLVWKLHRGRVLKVATKISVVLDARNYDVNMVCLVKKRATINDVWALDILLFILIFLYLEILYKSHTKLLEESDLTKKHTQGPMKLM